MDALAHRQGVTASPAQCPLDRDRSVLPVADSAARAASLESVEEAGDDELKFLFLDAGDAALADFKNLIATGNEAEIDVGDGLSVDADRALPEQASCFAG